MDLQGTKGNSLYDKEKFLYLSIVSIISLQDQLSFVISTTNTNTWTGVGFSDDEKMVCINIIKFAVSTKLADDIILSNTFHYCIIMFFLFYNNELK